MQKSKYKKLFRRIEWILKLGVFVTIMTFILLKKNDSAPAADEASFSEPDIASKQISLKGLSQEGIPTGCESVSTVALLNYLGIEITAEEFIDSFLPCKNFYRKNNLIYGPDPNEYFAGNPYETASLGCYPQVILKALRSMKSSGYPGMNDIVFRNVSGTDLETLTELFIMKDQPVLLWVTIGMKESREGMRYYLEDGTTYTWRAQEHCVVLCGYDEENYYMMDPLADGEIVGYTKNLVETRYQEMGKNAVIIFRQSFSNN